MRSDRWMTMCLRAATGVACLTAAGAVLHAGVVTAGGQEAVTERIRGDVEVSPVPDAQGRRNAPEMPSYYRDDTAEMKQRGLDRRQVEQAQDRYYKERSDEARKRSELMEREADEYYKRGK